MSTYAGLAATHTGFGASLGDAVRDGLSGFRQRFAASKGEYTANAGFHAPLGMGQTAKSAYTGTATATTTATERPVAQEKIAPMTSDSTGEAALATQHSALTSADQDRLSVQAALAGDQSAFADLVMRY